MAWFEKLTIGSLTLTMEATEVLPCTCPMKALEELFQCINHLGHVDLLYEIDKLKSVFTQLAT